MGQRVLWIQLEDKKRPYKHIVTDVNQDLDDLATEICEKKLKNIDPEDLEFYGDYDETENEDESGETEDDGSGDDGGSLPGGIQVQYLKTTDRSPLVVRYPLSDSFIVLNLKFLKTQVQITLTHSTGTWHELLAQTRNKFKKLKEGDEVYFVDQETKKLIIEDKVTFDRLLSKTEADEKNRIFIDLIVRIKGKKPYGDWSLNEVLDEILHKRYPSLLAMPELDIEQIKAHAKKLTDTDETTFVNNLKDIASSFHNDVNANKATARNFINPFMHKAVAMLREDYPTLRLRAKEVLSIISGILQSQANFYNERRVRARSDGREDDLQLQPELNIERQDRNDSGEGGSEERG
ncbi:hypothetical protein BC936DRAFT_137246 [Jimgerdemannia flammicorona]|uniref:Uncharacterized protein n=1 Tax=Jimgerdemannia flammicorona TaxID=994334 RepID=A0A433CXT8_9FUNG|nr:hypothetical protein BC936DRAFT_137246 [Jimgerdemannia flammicorona]